MRTEVKLAKEIIGKIRCPDYFWEKKTTEFIEFRTWLIMRLAAALKEKEK